MRGSLKEVGQGLNNISVIIPTWNRANIIEKAIYSALNQTIPPLEILVCDDGSTDNTFQLVHSIMISNPKVRWIDGPRGGRPAIPRNRGIAESKGNWLAFLDSDDQWFPEKLEKQLHLANKMGCKAVCSNAKRFSPDKGILGNLLSWSRKRLTFLDLLSVNLVICSSAMIQKSLFPLVEGFPEKQQLLASEDYALWLRVATQTDFSFVREPLLIYTDDPMASIRSIGADVLDQRTHVLSDFKKWSEINYIPKFYQRKVEREYISNFSPAPKYGLIDHILFSINQLVNRIFSSRLSRRKE